MCIFSDKTVGTNIPKNFVPAIKKAFLESCSKGLMSGHKVVGVRMTLVDGASHEVDSSDWAFFQVNSLISSLIYDMALHGTVHYVRTDP